MAKKNKYLLVVDLEPFRSLVKVKHSTGKEYQRQSAEEKIVDIQILITSEWNLLE